MLNVFTVSFFGHRRVDNFRLVESKLEKIIRELILSKQYVEFLVGRDGEFDQIVSSVIRRAKKNITDENCCHICVLPYIRAEYVNNKEYFEAYYDEIEICIKATFAHPKRAIQVRNRNMIDRSDLVVCFVERNSGGAYQSMRYGKLRGREVINIAEEDNHNI